MSQQRLIAAGFFSLVIIAVLAVIIYTDHVSSSSTVGVYVLQKDVSAGAPMATGDVKLVSVKADQNEFLTAESRGLAKQLIGKVRYVSGMHQNDILRTDDTQAVNAKAEVPVTFVSAPGIAVGDTVDIFANLSDGSTANIGQHIPVISLGTPAIIAVPAADERLWIAIQFGTAKLIAVKSTGATVVPGSKIDPSSAICTLAGSNCSGTPPNSPPSSP